jgi:hypothetical protein
MSAVHVLPGPWLAPGGWFQVPSGLSAWSPDRLGAELEEKTQSFALGSSEHLPLQRKMAVKLLLGAVALACPLTVGLQPRPLVCL